MIYDIIVINKTIKNIYNIKAMEEQIRDKIILLNQNIMYVDAHIKIKYVITKSK